MTPRDLKFNEHVCVEGLINVPDAKRTGRVVQIRKGCGAFGSDVFIIRLRCGTLQAFENVMVRRANDARFEHAYYIANGMTPPDIPEQAPYDGDTESTEYSMNGGKYPETGFIVSNPSQPETPGSFTMIIKEG